MMKLLYKVVLWVEGFSQIRLSGTSWKRIGVSLVVLLSIIGLGLGIRQTVVMKAESDRLNRQRELVIERTSELNEVEQATWAKTNEEVSSEVWEALKNNPDDATVLRYANLLVNVNSETTRQNAYTAIPWLDSEVGKDLGKSQSSYGYYDKAKTVELLTSGKSYGEAVEYHSFVYNTVWNSTTGDTFPARETISITIQNGKVTNWSHIVGRR